MQNLFVVLAALVFCDFATCLFYTSSKENDYPRIGKRHDQRLSDVWVETDIFDEYNDIMDSNEIKPSQNRAPSRPSLIRKGTITLFKLLDRNGDQVITKDEFTTNSFTEILEALTNQQRRKGYKKK